jgi:hypothetical protein
VRHTFAAAVLLGALSSAPLLNADEAITVSVYPQIAVARGNAQLKIFVERNGQNRMLNWEVDGPAYYRSSTAQLDGAEAPRSWFYFVRDLPEGTYAVRATVKRSNNSESVARAAITVLPGLRAPDR